MAAVTNTSGQKVILEGVSWETYERLLAEHPDKPGTLDSDLLGSALHDPKLIGFDFGTDFVWLQLFVSTVTLAEIRYGIEIEIEKAREAGLVENASIRSRGHDGFSFEKTVIAKRSAELSESDRRRPGRGPLLPCGYLSCMTGNRTACDRAARTSVCNEYKFPEEIQK